MEAREGLKVPRKQRERRTPRAERERHSPPAFQHKDHVWCVDFIHDRDEAGQPLKWLSIVDEFTRECLALEVERGMGAADVAEVFIDLFTTRGVPVHIRSDNGGEFIAAAIRRLATLTAVESLYIAPGSPWENGYAESFHSHLRDELLNAELFADVHKAKALATAWREEYNHRRPHSSLGYVPPAVFAAWCQSPLPSRAPVPAGGDTMKDAEPRTLPERKDETPSLLSGSPLCPPEGIPRTKRRHRRGVRDARYTHPPTLIETGTEIGGRSHPPRKPRTPPRKAPYPSYLRLDLHRTHRKRPPKRILKILAPLHGLDLRQFRAARCSRLPARRAT